MALFKLGSICRLTIVSKSMIATLQTSVSCFTTQSTNSLQLKCSHKNLNSSILMTSVNQSLFFNKGNFQYMCKYPFFINSFRKCSTGANHNDDVKGPQVYEGRVKSLLKRVKIFSLSTSLFGLAGQPYLWYTVQDMSLLFAAPLFTAVNFFVFANPLMIHYLAKRYVTELYYNSETSTYTAFYLSFFGRRQSFSFTPDDVVVPEIPGMFSMLTAKGRPLFVDYRDFTSIEIYKKMMGFDKPLNLTYTSQSNEQKS